MARTLHCLFLALIALAVVGGPTAHLAKSVATMAPIAMASMPCDMAAMPTPMAEAGDRQPMAPCNGLTPDCIKQMGCIVDIAIPVRMASVGLLLSFRAIDWSQVQPALFGTDRTPDPMPPRTI